MRKLIDIDEETVKRLRVMSAIKGKDVKNYIQDLIEDHTKNFQINGMVEHKGKKSKSKVSNGLRGQKNY